MRLHSFHRVTTLLSSKNVYLQTISTSFSISQKRSIQQGNRHLTIPSTCNPIFLALSSTPVFFSQAQSEMAQRACNAPGVMKISRLYKSYIFESAFGSLIWVQDKKIFAQDSAFICALSDTSPVRYASHGSSASINQVLERLENKTLHSISLSIRLSFYLERRSTTVSLRHMTVLILCSSFSKRAIICPTGQLYCSRSPRPPFLI